MSLQPRPGRISHKTASSGRISGVSFDSARSRHATGRFLAGVDLEYSWLWMLNEGELLIGFLILTRGEDMGRNWSKAGPIACGN